MPVPQLMHFLKRYTARAGNRILGMTGPFWQVESFDRLVRNEHEFRRIDQHIEMNPVKAVKAGQRWPRKISMEQREADCRSAAEPRALAGGFRIETNLTVTALEAN